MKEDKVSAAMVKECDDEEAAKHPMQLFFESEKDAVAFNSANQDTVPEIAQEETVSMASTTTRAAFKNESGKDEDAICEEAVLDGHRKEDNAIGEETSLDGHTVPARTSSSVAHVGAFYVQGPGIDGNSKEEAQESSSFHPAAIETPETFVVKEATLALGTETETDSSDQLQDLELVDAKILPKRRQRLPKRRERQSRTSCMVVWVGLAFLLLLAAAVAIVLGVLLPASSEKSEEKSLPASVEKSAEKFKEKFMGNGTAGDPGSSSEDILYPPFAGSLQSHLIDATEDLGSPHHKANRWVLQDPNFDSYSPERLQQRFHCSSFHFLFGGDDWHQNDNWLSCDVSECEWFSQTDPQHNLCDDCPVCDEDNNLLKLNLAENNLQGTMPIILDFIPTLRVFNVGDNLVEGSLSSSSKLPELEVEVFSNDSFSGQTGSNGEFYAFKARVLKSDGNLFAGDGYDMLFELMTELEINHGDNNKFGGGIPTTLGSPTNLREHTVGANLVTGAIPTYLGTLKALEKLDLSDNIAITGTTPSELEMLTTLKFLDTSGTSITGAVQHPNLPMIGYT